MAKSCTKIVSFSAIVMTKQISLTKTTFSCSRSKTRRRGSRVLADLAVVLEVVPVPVVHPLSQ